MKEIEESYSIFLKEFPYPRKLRAYDWQVQKEYTACVFQEQHILHDFSSNDYLGLSKHPLLIQRSQEYAKTYGSGASSSRLVRGNHMLYQQIENQLAHALNKEAALIFPTGYQTNMTVIEALLDNKVLKQKPIVL